MIEVVASSRPTWSPGTAKITFAVPAAAKNGDLLAILLASEFAEPTFATPAGWSVVDDVGASDAKLALLAKLVDDGEPTSVVVSVTGATKERQGQLVVLRGTSPPALLEAAATGTFAATTTPATPASSAQQAINVGLVAYSSTGAVTLSPPAGFTAIDAYSSALASSRSFAVAWKRIGATGAFAPGAASSVGAATGRAWTKVLRDRAPHLPATLADPLGGNIGLLP